MAAQDIRAAKRYANALFDAAQKQNALDTVVNDLEAVKTLMEQIPALRRTWDSPLMPAGRKRAAISRVLGESLHPLTLSFLRLLVDKRREETLDAAIKELHLFTDRAHHLIRAEAIFAVTPTTEEQANLQRSLERRTGEQVALTVSVHSEILGGVVVRMQDTLIDGSVRGALERLRERLLMEA